MNPVDTAYVLKLSGLLALMFSLGYISGICTRAFRQFFEKATS